MVQEQAIYLANEDGSGIRKTLSFERVPSFTDWTFFPVPIPLPDGSGFRVVIPTSHPENIPAEPSTLWEIPNTGASVPIYSYIQNGNLYYAISPDGKAVTYYDGSGHICVHTEGISMENCDGEKNSHFFVNWSPDNRRYISCMVSGLSSSGTDIYTFSLAEINFQPVPIQTSLWMLWIDSEQYLYVTEELDLYLGSLLDNQVKIDKGIVRMGLDSPKWTWQFDYSY